MKYEQWLIIEEGREKAFVILNLFFLCFDSSTVREWDIIRSGRNQTSFIRKNIFLPIHIWRQFFFLFVFCHQTSDRSEVNEPKNVVDFTMNEYDFMVIILEFDDNIVWMRFIRIFYRFSVDHYGGQFSVAIFILRWLI